MVKCGEREGKQRERARGGWEMVAHPRCQLATACPPATCTQPPARAAGGMYEWPAPVRHCNSDASAGEYQ